ncbi:LCP family protein [Microbacterium sp.]|uniref:LCP family protein n=1 Tax=Microbacterium sp. TaxID=51671 RepID=UPI003A848266
MSAPSPTRRRRWPWIVVFSVFGVLVAGAGLGAAYLWSLAAAYADNVTTLPEGDVFPDGSTRPTQDPAHTEATNILLLGSDERGQTSVDDPAEIGDRRADTIMMVHIPADRDKVQVMSIMRDNWVSIPGHGEHKINAALALGGIPLLVETVESIVDVPIDHVAIIDFEGFRGLTDALGGVTVDNAQAFDARGHTFPAGAITLDGDDALVYVRERYAFPDGDYQRVRNQQAYVRAVLARLLDRATLTDPGRIHDTLGAIAPYLTVDEGLDAATIAGIAVTLRDMRADDVHFFTAPTLGTAMIGDQSVVLPDTDALTEVAEALRTDTVDDYLRRQDP